MTGANASPIGRSGQMMKVFKNIWIVLFVAGALAAQSSTSTQTARPKIDVSKLGPQVGERVPDFSLNDLTHSWSVRQVNWGGRHGSACRKDLNYPLRWLE